MHVCTFNRDNRKKITVDFHLTRSKCAFVVSSNTAPVGHHTENFGPFFLTAQCGKNREWQMTPFLHLLASLWTIPSQLRYQNVRAHFGAGAKTNLFDFLRRGVNHHFELLLSTNFNRWRFIKVWEREKAQKYFRYWHLLKAVYIRHGWTAYHQPSAKCGWRGFQSNPQNPGRELRWHSLGSVLRHNLDRQNIQKFLILFKTPLETVHYAFSQAG